ncbi:CBO0543 family protein [Paenibacillus flagellatus]|uniref:Uncharacterized protein n=1 Tax=Paenibacillus flagellatus TaxID=2211139 RepID=A0A2V5KJ69_9BACL|nr:CBO0543 family protein [Paenibacillus flagellatus]PYI50407.1 hypothetical protein DLM86_29640 [Paenibacillus flagellatus]
MSVDWYILIGVWAAGAAMLVFFVPKERSRVAQVAFLIKQLITWVIGLVVVEIGLLEYPTREFASINRTSFTFEFFAYPAVCALFNARYPTGSGWVKQLSYFSAYCSVMTVTEVLIEANTRLIRYDEWSWYWTWISLFLTFMGSRLFCVWFFRSYAAPGKPSGGKEKNAGNGAEDG